MAGSIKELEEWLEEWLPRLKKNHRPSPQLQRLVFFWAQFVDPKGNHKPSSCNRCYMNAVRALINWQKTHKKQN